MLGTPPVHPPERVFRAAMRLTTRPGVSLPEAEDEQADGAHSAPEDCGATPMAAGSLGAFLECRFVVNIMFYNL